MHDLVVAGPDLADAARPTALRGGLLQHHAASPRRTARIGWMKCRMLREPSVSWLPYFVSSPGAWTILTRAQSASISSAIIIGRLVRDARAHLGAVGDDGDGAVWRRSTMKTCGSLTVPCGMPAGAGRIGQRRAPRHQPDGQHEAAAPRRRP